MPRPVWSGAISFGLVTIPIRVLPATEDHNIHFHQYHLEDEGRVRNQKTCEIDGQVLSQDEIGKGYEVAKDQVVPVSDDELDEMPLPTAKAIEIVAFTPADDIDPVRMSAGYYLEGDGAVATKPYVLLRKALQRSSKVAIAKFAWHDRERLGLLRVKDDVIVLQSLKWPDEIRDVAAAAPPEVEVDDEEIDQAVELMESMGQDDVSGYTDHYREAVEELLAAKAAHREPKPLDSGEGEETKGRVIDLMAALNASVEAAAAGRSDGGHATVHDLSDHAAKKTTGTKKKSAAKKTTAKKTTGKKAAGRKPKSA
ncbi:Ku protein [Streptomyces sp. NBC_01411]|uniref:non-homologous end joining protein Ku n=1 Tax=Streptomyces sp. NBC_01411 TaxID=2903857 RepID=UPI00324D1118